MPNDAGSDARLPIGVFDSGVGGLTVLAALCARLPQQQGLLAPAAAGGTSVQLLATDGAERFALVGTRFLGRHIAPAEVELVDL